MNDMRKHEIHLVTGVVIAIDDEDGVLIAGMLSDSPFKDDNQELTPKRNLVSSFAFTRQKAKFLRDSLNEFLKD